MGTLYLRANTWWIKYYRNGKPYSYFTDLKAANITTDLIQCYILHRQGDEAENGTINRELSEGLSERVSKRHHEASERLKRVTSSYKMVTVSKGEKLTHELENSQVIDFKGGAREGS